MQTVQGDHVAARKRKGSYFGTEINEQWWRRYVKDGMLARGAGEYWFDDRCFFFRRYLTRTPIVIDFDNLIAIKTGRWHAGRWAGGALLIKFIWQKEAVRLSSGFLLSGDRFDTETMVADLSRRLKSGC